MATGASGCVGDGGQDTAATEPDGACSSPDVRTVEEVLVTGSVRADDESTGLEAETSARLVCRWTPDVEGPSLVLQVAAESTPGRAERDIDATRATCEGAEPLEVDDTTGFLCPTGDLGGGPQVHATWDGLDVDVALTESRRSGSRDSAGLRAITSELRTSLSRQDISTAIDAER